MKDINELISRFFVATDDRRWEEVRGYFAPVVRLDYSSMNNVPAADLEADQIIANWKAILPGFDFTHHQIGNFVSSVAGKTARVFCYGTASHYLSDSIESLWTVVGSYDFELTLDDQDQWKIASMKFNFKFQDGNSHLPEKAMSLAQAQ